MTGNDDHLQPGTYSCVPLEERIPSAHPLRVVRKLVATALAEMSRVLDGLYAKAERSSIPPERLFRSRMLQVFYSVRGERLLMEQLNYNLLFRWFVGLELEEPVWNREVFSENRTRLLNDELTHRFLAKIKAQAQGLTSDERFTADGCGPA